MSQEHIPPTTDPEGAPSLQEQILAGFQRLPDDEKAAVWTRLRATVEGEPDPLHAVFPITGVSRNDLLERLHYPEETLAELDDATMCEIAGRLEDAYVELEFWHHLRIVTDDVLAQKRRLSPRS